MERYSKTSSSKFQNRYSEEFKEFVCREFLTGTLLRGTIERKYNIGRGSLTTWLKNLGYDYAKSSIVSLPGMSKSKKSSEDEEKNLSQLHRELEEAKLLTETYRKMIEIAEKEFKIKIIKKSNTK